MLYTPTKDGKKKVDFIVSEIQSPTDDCAYKGKGRGGLPFESFERMRGPGTIRRLQSGKAGIPFRFRASTCAGAYTKCVYKNNARAQPKSEQKPLTPYVLVSSAE